MGKLVLDDDRAEAALPEALLRSEAYPHAAQRPRLITTHISWILLAGRFAYKLKRPVDLGFVDYTTRDRREHFCQEELLLNRRLTRDVYLDVVPIVQTPAGIRVSGDGAVIDHAVRMRRLPQQRMLNRLLARGDIDGEQAAEIGSLIARFHATATRAAPGEPRWRCHRSREYRRELPSDPTVRQSDHHSRTVRSDHIVLRTLRQAE